MVICSGLRPACVALGDLGTISICHSRTSTHRYNQSANLNTPEPIIRRHFSADHSKDFSSRITCDLEVLYSAEIQQCWLKPFERVVWNQFTKVFSFFFDYYFFIIKYHFYRLRLVVERCYFWNLFDSFGFPVKYLVRNFRQKKLSKEIQLPLRFRKVRRVLYSGARETHWATSHNIFHSSQSQGVSKIILLF